jgi:N-glycosidase YbiA
MANIGALLPGKTSIIFLSFQTNFANTQAQKFAGTADEEEIRLMPKPMAAAQAGRSRSRPCKSNWEEVKESVMKEALIAKFTQHKSLAKLLLGTGDAVVVEASATDYYWGRGGKEKKERQRRPTEREGEGTILTAFLFLAADGTGKNRLGYLLMVVRRELAAGT